MTHLRTAPIIAILLLAPVLSRARDQQAPKKVAYRFNITVTDPTTKKTTKVGTAEYISSSTDTERVTSFKVDAKDGADTISYIIEKTLDLHGVPKMTTYSQVLDGQSSKATAKFVPGGVEVTTDSLVDVKTIPLPKGGILADASEEWFKTVTPKVGDVTETTYFDIRHTRWIKMTTKYVDDLNIQIGEKKYATHRLHITSDIGDEDFYVDSHGDPVLIDESPQHVERAE